MDARGIATIACSVVAILVLTCIEIYFFRRGKEEEKKIREADVNVAFAVQEEKIKQGMLEFKKSLDATLEKSESAYQISAFDFASDLFHRTESGEFPGIADTVTIINHLSESDVITAITCYGSNIVNALYYNAKYHLGHFPQEGEEYHDVFKRYTDALEYGVHALHELYEVQHRRELIRGYEKDGCTKAEAIQLAEQKIHNDKILQQGEENIMLQKKQIEMMQEQNAAMANNFDKLRDDVRSGMREISAEQSRTASTVAMLGLLQNGRM